MRPKKTTVHNHSKNLIKTLMCTVTQSDTITISQTLNPADTIRRINVGLMLV